MKQIYWLVAILTGLAVLIYGFKDRLIRQRVETPDNGPQEEIIAENLNIPWEIDWLDDGTMLVTERPGRLALSFNQQP